MVFESEIDVCNDHLLTILTAYSGFDVLAFVVNFSAI